MFSRATTISVNGFANVTSSLVMVLAFEYLGYNNFAIMLLNKKSLGIILVHSLISLSFDTKTKEATLKYKQVQKISLNW